uniref:S-adenosylmethionine:tRNA ribosyltransferase-isomerase n=1 Tax=Amorphochlora amoebiformis TaxID=1561963 RepID=A0A7S0D659_9EUKA
MSPDDFNYNLPQERIALFPAEPRDSSRLLVTTPGGSPKEVVIPEIPGDSQAAAVLDEGIVTHHRMFRDISKLVAPGTMMIFNESRVIPARITARKEITEHGQGGGRAEVMCLHPLQPTTDPGAALLAKSGKAVWRALVKGRNIAEGSRLFADLQGSSLECLIEARDGRDADVRFSWEGDMNWAEVLEKAGEVPLPPYMNRDAQKSDRDRYQTVYADDDQKGSVAAPTAGLHFSPEIIESLDTAGVDSARVTLHVGAGTFQPVTAKRVQDHSMHTEQISISLEYLDKINEAVATGAPILPVGTTAARTLESLYWMGVALTIDPIQVGEWGPESLRLGQWDAWRMKEALDSESKGIGIHESFRSLRRWARKRGHDSVIGHTQLLIVPGYKFALCDALLTNFHQPKSTLLMMISALMGGPTPVRSVYERALESKVGYRFLSYGDACLLEASSDSLRDCRPVRNHPALLKLR